MRLATLCTTGQRHCLPLHMAVRLTPAVDSVQVGLVTVAKQLLRTSRVCEARYENAPAKV